MALTERFLLLSAMVVSNTFYKTLSFLIRDNLYNHHPLGDNYEFQLTAFYSYLFAYKLNYQMSNSYVCVTDSIFLQGYV